MKNLEELFSTYKMKPIRDADMLLASDRMRLACVVNDIHTGMPIT